MAILRRLDEISRGLGVAPGISESTASLWRIHLFSAFAVVAVCVILFVAGEHLAGAVFLLLGVPISGAWAWKGWTYQRDRQFRAQPTPNRENGPEKPSS